MPLDGEVAWASMKGVPIQKMSRKRPNQANRVFAVDICTPTGTQVTVPPEITRRKLKLFMGAIGIRNGKTSPALEKNWSAGEPQRRVYFFLAATSRRVSARFKSPAVRLKSSSVCQLARADSARCLASC